MMMMMKRQTNSGCCTRRMIFCSTWTYWTFLAVLLICTPCCTSRCGWWPAFVGLVGGLHHHHHHKVQAPAITTRTTTRTISAFSPSCLSTTTTAAAVRPAAVTTAVGTTRRQVMGQSMWMSSGGLFLTAPHDVASAASLLQGDATGDAANTLSSSSLSSSRTMAGITASADPPFSFQTYQVLPDASEALNPQLQELKSSSFLDRIATMSPGGAVWLGEHHNSVPDHVLQAQMLASLRARRPPHLPVAVGLEQIQIQFQPVLDEYSAGRLSVTELRQRVEWDQRWTWSFDVYEPIFRMAQKLGVSLIALNVNSEDLEYVERYGFPGLPPDRMRQYIGDPSGFAAFARPHQFSSYVDYVIAPSYQLHQEMGLLQRTMSGIKLDETMSFRKFLSGRMLWDESMAWHAYQWTVQNPGGLLVGLVGADHVKFRHGIPGRFSRLANGTSDCVAVLLNPTLIDSRPSNVIATSPEAMTSQRPDQITLQLRYEETNATVGVLPLADYLVLG